MLKKNVRWSESETRKIYRANKKSENLMEYLESELYKANIVDSCADSPNHDRGYGRMVYYLQTRRVLTAAPRKVKEHILVVFSKKLDKSELKEREIPLGNGNDDVLLSEKSQIDSLIMVLKQRYTEFVKDSSVPYHTRTLEEWVKTLLDDKEALNKEQAIALEREKFLSEFTELDELRNKSIDISEFKKRLDQKMKSKLEIESNKINIWGFSGFSGQMFFNLLYNQAKYLNVLDDFTEIFIKTIEIPKHEEGDFTWTKEKYEDFSDFISEMKKKAVSKGYPPQKCPSIKYMTFFISFFWGIQNLKKYPIFYKASRDGLDYLGYSNYDDENAADSIRYMHFVENIHSLYTDLVPFVKEKESIDMEFIGHLLYYVKSRIEESDFESKFDPITDDPFAVKIRDVLFEQGYNMPIMETVDIESINLDEEVLDQPMWHYSGHDGKDISGILFIWENEDDFKAVIYLENSDGQFLKGSKIHTEDDHHFLEELENYLKKATVKKKPYTIEDVARETYISEETLEEWLELLTEQRQVILYGPPGTGKTYLAERLAKVLTQQSQLVQLIQFHPSYTYEEFIEGLRPELVEVNDLQQITVKIEPGIFSRICNEARKPENQHKSYVLIIDEINRANTAKVFGELLYALEYRNNPIPLPYSKKKLIVPDNIYIIGTMNTTDRSLAQLDFALRRRFQFIPFSASETETILENYLMDHQENMVWVAQLIREVNELIDDPDISIGHSYFIGEELSVKKLEKIWKYQIMPYLEECFVHDHEKLSQFNLRTLLEMVDINE